MKRFTFMLMIAMLLSAGATNGGEYNLTLHIGDEAPVWKDLPGVDGHPHALADLKDHKVVVVVFTCNSCPYAQDVEDRLIAWEKKWSPRGVALVAINVNKVEADRLPAMKQKAKQKGFKFPYLFDESQQIAKDYGAKYTPEFFVLNGERKVIYMGSMDDSPDGKNVQKEYIRLAVESTLEGKPPEITETVPIGCRVRFDRERRRRRTK